MFCRAWPLLQAHTVPPALLHPPCPPFSSCADHSDQPPRPAGHAHAHTHADAHALWQVNFLTTGGGKVSTAWCACCSVACHQAAWPCLRGSLMHEEELLHWAMQRGGGAPEPGGPSIAPAPMHAPPPPLLAASMPARAASCPPPLLPPHTPPPPPPPCLPACLPKVRFNPNLYNCGKVCLSLLGTWAGPSWDPAASTLMQVRQVGQEGQGRGREAGRALPCPTAWEDGAAGCVEVDVRGCVWAGVGLVGKGECEVRRPFRRAGRQAGRRRACRQAGRRAGRWAGGQAGR